MTRLEQDLAAARAASEEQQARTKRENAGRCPWCNDTGDVCDTTGEWRGACVCSAAEHKNSAGEAP